MSGPRALLPALVFCASLVMAAQEAPAPAEPLLEIELWQGDVQSFGDHGVPQRWVNVLGTVRASVPGERLEYRLNEGQPRRLTVGPDGRRLVAQGDFNIDLERRDLRAGTNRLTIEAEDARGEVLTRSMTLEYEPRRASLPLELNWSRFEKVEEAAQIVDGRWALTPTGLRTAAGSVAYDRTVAIGDQAWSDYELIVPITVHAVDRSGYSKISVAPGFGLVLCWQGHTGAPVQCPQPRCGWEPAGATVFYEVFEEGNAELRLTPKAPATRTGASSVQFELGETYLVKVRAETTVVGPQYSLKAWLEGEVEPDDWQTHLLAGPFPVARGSILLVAHHLDVTFGNLQVLPLTLGSLSVPPALRPLVPAMPLVLVCLVALFALGRRGGLTRGATWMLRAALVLVAAGSLAHRFLENQMYSLLRDLDLEIYQVKRLILLVDVGWYSLLALLVGVMLWAVTRGLVGRSGSKENPR